MKTYFVYILANKKNGTIYIGVTNDIARRIEDHRTGLIDGFTKKYGLKNLVYVEQHDNIENAIMREKRLKNWNRAWKMRLIQQENPDWQDLSDRI
jgi:putative endonuclease